MVNQQPANRQAVLDLQQSVAQLRRTIAVMQEQRERMSHQRRRRLILYGGSISLVLHVLLMVYLALVYRGGGGGGGGEAQAASYELAIINQEELTSGEPTSFDQLESQAVSFDSPAALTETAALTAASPAAGGGELGASAGAAPTLSGSGGGTGGGGEMGLGGGGGGGATSFFGIASKGTRFAYIVDISGSMSEHRKLEIAKRELIRSIDALPDYSSFYVLLFSTDFVQPPSQKGWTRARKPAVRQLIAWLNEVDPSGGTAPRTSFMQVFNLETRPDVIYFLTDGLFQDITAEEISELNRHGKRAIINTIQFGDRSGEDLLRSIAKLTGGVYRFIPAEAR